MIGLVWRLEWRIAFVRRRLFVLNVAIPLVLVAAIAFSDAPAGHAAAVIAVLFALHGTLGSAIPLVRDAESGLVTRAWRSGVRPSHMLLERAGAGACLDALQLGLSLGVIAVAAGAPMGTLLAAALGVLGTLWVANLLGVLVAAAARSLAEAALFAAVLTLVLLHLSGVFRTGAPGSTSAMLEDVSPFRALHESLLGMLAPIPPGGFASMAVWAAGLPVLVALLSGPLIRLLGDASSGR